MGASQLANRSHKFWEMCPEKWSDPRIAIAEPGSACFLGLLALAAACLSLSDSFVFGALPRPGSFLQEFGSISRLLSAPLLKVFNF